MQTEYLLLSSQILSSGPNFLSPFYCHIQKCSLDQNFRNKIFFFLISMKYWLRDFVKCIYKQFFIISFETFHA